jgi:hypothetical protein
MDELGKALKAIFDKLSEFIDLFDLSFLVSGILTASAFYFVYVLNDPLNIKLDKIDDWFKYFLILFFCYINGLISFAIGRLIRTEVVYRKDNYTFDLRIKESLEAHGVFNDPLIQMYFNNQIKRGAWRLYIRLWAEIRIKEKLSPSFSLLKRYWVMTATYDGVAFSIFSWTIIILLWAFGLFKENPPSYYILVPILISLGFIFYYTIREAQRYWYYQIEELIATFASK